jgi:hypothetical protein
MQYLLIVKKKEKKEGYDFPVSYQKEKKIVYFGNLYIYSTVSCYPPPMESGGGYSFGVVRPSVIGISRFYYLTQNYGSVIALNIYQVQRILLFMP